MKKIIGVVDIAQSEYRSLLLNPYLESLERAGAEYRLIPWDTSSEDLKDIVSSCDGFLFTGGNDLVPSRYGEEKLPECGETTPQRDELEASLLKLIIPTGKPVMGICRGIQTINVALGGTLYQDLPTQHPSDVRHKPDKVELIKEPLHAVVIKENCILADAMGSGEHMVNSSHHQCVKALGKGLRAVANSADGLIEAIQMDDYGFFTAVQWHPEHLSDRIESQQNIFNMFVTACK